MFSERCAGDLKGKEEGKVSETMDPLTFRGKWNKGKSQGLGRSKRSLPKPSCDILSERFLTLAGDRPPL